MSTPTDSLLAADGTRLKLHRWPSAPRRGTVLIVHGLGEHAGRYAHVAAWLAERGFAALAYDQRGHGLSDGNRGIIPTPNALVDDLATVVARRYRRPDRPVARDKYNACQDADDNADRISDEIDTL